jgi:hypothetical protein
MMLGMPSTRPQPGWSHWSTATLRLATLLLFFGIGFLVNEYELVRFVDQSVPVAQLDDKFVAIGATAAVVPPPLPTPRPSGSLKAARDVAVELRAELVQRAPHGDYRFFQRTMPLDGREYALAAKFAHAIVTQQPFVVGVIGTSNAACHDNEVTDCFPFYFADDLRRLLKPLAVDVVLRNRGIGGINSVMPSMCVETLVGSDVDVVLFEFVMSDAGMPCAPSTHEMLGRRALELPKQPFVTFVEVEGGRRKDERAEAHTTERDLHFEDWSPHTQLRRHYGDAGLHHLEMLDGLHLVDTVEGWRYEDLFITFHPGPKGHRYLADQLSFYHVAALLMALDLLVDAPDAFRTPRRVALPPPLYCGRWCAGERPDCYTSFQTIELQNKTLAQAMRIAALPVLAPEDINALSVEKLPPDAKGWQRVLPVDQNVHAERHYADAKLAWFARGGAGPRNFTVQVPRGGVGTIVVCQAPPVWGKLASGQAELSLLSEVRYAVDGVAAQPAFVDSLGGLAQCGDAWRQNCVAFGDGLSAGWHSLQIEPLSNAYILVAHAIGV